MKTADPLENVRGCWWAFYEFSQEQPAYFQLMFVDRSVPRITQQWEGFEFLQQMLTNAVTAIQKAIDAGAFPEIAQPERGDAHVVGVVDRPGGRRPPPSPRQRRRLRRARARRAQRHHRRPAAGVATTFVSCKCPEEGIAGAPVPAGVRRHES